MTRVSETHKGDVPAWNDAADALDKIRAVLERHAVMRPRKCVLGAKEQSATHLPQFRARGGDLVTFNNPTTEKIRVVFKDTTLFELDEICVYPGGSPTLQLESECGDVYVAIDDSRNSPQYIIVNPTEERIDYGAAGS